MCMVSVIGDYYKDKWKKKPWYTDPAFPFTKPIPVTDISRAEFEALRQEVQDLKELLKRAKEYDAKTGQPDCEIEDKICLLRKIAKAVGVNLDDVLKPQTTPPNPFGQTLT